MRRTLVIIMLLLWLLQCSWPVAEYYFGLEEIRTEHENGIFDEPVIRLVFRDQSNIDWIEEGKEFVVNGLHFDVKSLKDSSGSIVITAYRDTKEEMLLDQFHRSNSNHDKKEQGWLKKWNKIKLYTSQNSYINPAYPGNGSKDAEFICMIPDKIYKGVSHPPPDFI